MKEHEEEVWGRIGKRKRRRSRGKQEGEVKENEK